MWKKDEVTPEHPGKSAPATVGAGRGDASLAKASSRSLASIGTSITIRGEVTGDEDLLIEGRVEGSVDLKQHAVTVGSEGQVKAGISGRVVTVEGTVHGDLRADDMVVLRSTAQVEGDITAPRVVLEEGASFRGAVDMGGGVSTAAREDAKGAKDKSPLPAPASRSAPGSESASAAKGSKGDGPTNAAAVSP